MARRRASEPTTRHPSQLLALAIGAVYTLVGLLGFLVTGLAWIHRSANAVAGFLTWPKARREGVRVA
jgi:hypothetical protein